MDSNLVHALLAAALLPAEAHWQLAQTLAIELRRDADLVALRQASPVLYGHLRERYGEAKAFEAGALGRLRTLEFRGTPTTISPRYTGPS